MQPVLYYSDKTNKTYCKEDHKCCDCNKTIKNIGVLIVRHLVTRKLIEPVFFCSYCFNNNKLFGHITEFRLVVFDKVIPTGSRPLFINKIELVNSGRDISVFDINKIYKKYPKAQEINKSQLNYVSIKGATIGNNDFIRICEEKDKRVVGR